MPKIKISSLAFALAIFSLTAKSSIIDVPVAVATTSCSFNGSPVDCVSNGTVRIETASSSGFSGFGTADGINPWVGAAAWVTSIAPGFSYASAQSSISMNFLASTDGPIREGFATFFTIVEADHGGGGSGMGGISIEGLGGCTYGGSMHCTDRGTLVPFTLGTQFAISIFAIGSGPRDGGGSAFSRMMLQLFELDGSPVAIYDPPALAMPEPGNIAMVGFSLLFFATLVIPWRKFTMQKLKDAAVVTAIMGAIIGVAAVSIPLMLVAVLGWRPGPTAERIP